MDQTVLTMRQLAKSSEVTYCHKRLNSKCVHFILIFFLSYLAPAWKPRASASDRAFAQTYRLRSKTPVQLLLWVYTHCASSFVFPGQSMISFIYDFVERFEGPHPGYAVLSGRPQSGILHAITLIAFFLFFSYNIITQLEVHLESNHKLSSFIYVNV